MFNSELEMQKIFVSFLKNEHLENTFISEEFNARFGNVDIVKVKYKNRQPISNAQAIILSNIACAKIVGYLHKNSVRTLKYLISKTGFTSEYVLSLLAKLKREKVIEEIYYHKYIINSQFVFPKLTFTSYEAKLTDWKKAVSQAIKNQKFSTESYVVMPEKITKSVFQKHKDYFKLYKIGLISINEYGYKIYIKAGIQKKNYSRASTICSIAKYLMLEKQYV